MKLKAILDFPGGCEPFEAVFIKQSDGILKVSMPSDNGEWYYYEFEGDSTLNFRGTNNINSFVVVGNWEGILYNGSVVVDVCVIEEWN